MRATGHGAIVGTFAAITTPAMQAEWGAADALTGNLDFVRPVAGGAGLGVRCEP